MNEDLENEEDLIRLGEIFETLRKDALEVSDLLVKGIEFYKLTAYISIAIGIFAIWQLFQYIESGNIVMSAVWTLLLAITWFGGIYGIWKNRKLKSKYEELIDIHKSLTEE